MKIVLKRLECTSTGREPATSFYLSAGGDPFWEGEVRAGESADIGLELVCPDDATVAVSVGYSFTHTSGMRDRCQLTCLYAFRDVRGDNKTVRFEDSSGRKGAVHYAIEA